MAGFLDISPALAEKFESLSTLFSRFSFPSLPYHHASQLELDYWNVVRDFLAIDPINFDSIVKTCLEDFELRELELQMTMTLDNLEPENWLEKFIRRLDVAKQESMDSFATAFSPSQTALSQEDPAPPGM